MKIGQKSVNSFKFITRINKKVVVPDFAWTYPLLSATLSKVRVEVVPTAITRRALLIIWLLSVFIHNTLIP